MACCLAASLQRSDRAIPLGAQLDGDLFETCRLRADLRGLRGLLGVDRRKIEDWESDAESHGGILNGGRESIEPAEPAAFCFGAGASRIRR